MSQKPENTEYTILQAASKVFVKHGFEGATMQMIANEAGLNKALLHYYFRNKEKLFESVFEETFGKIVPPLMSMIMSEAPFLEKIKFFIAQYIDSIHKHQFIPLFILHELQRNPERIIQLVRNSGIDPSIILRAIQEEIDAGNIIKIDSTQLLVNILSMCIFPFAARPMIQGVFFDNNPELYETFLEERKSEVTDFVINAIKKR